MKVDDAIFAISFQGRRLGTCFVTEVSGRELIVTCQHIFEEIERFDKQKYEVHDIKYSFTASIIEVSEADIVVLLPDERLTCSRLFLLPNDTFIEFPRSLGLYGYSLGDEAFSGTMIDEIRFKAIVPPYGNIIAKIDRDSTGRLNEGLSGSPLIWASTGSPGSVFGMFHGNDEKHGEATFVSSKTIYDLIDSSQKIHQRLPRRTGGTVPNVEGIWEFCLDENTTLFHMNDLDLYSRGYIHILQNEEELHGTAVNFLYSNRLEETLLATFIYEIIHAQVVEKQFDVINLHCTCYLVDRAFAHKDDFTQATEITDHIRAHYPKNVTLDINAVLSLSSGHSIGAWKINDSDRKGDIILSSYRYKFILPTKSTDSLKTQVFQRELKRNIAIDHLDGLNSTRYHVIQNHKGDVVAQCRETRFSEMEMSIQNRYSLIEPQHCAFLSKLCIERSQRFKQLERKLGVNIIRTLFKSGYREFALNCCRSHIRIYERLGFIHCGDKYMCPEVNDEVYPYRCDIQTLISKPLFTSSLV